MALIPNGNEDTKSLVAVVQTQIRATIVEHNGLVLLCKAKNRDIGQAKLIKNIACHVDLPMPTIDQNKVWFLEVLLNHPRIATVDGLTHSAKVVYGPLQTSYVETSVASWIGVAVYKRNEACNGVLSRKLSYVETLYELRKLLKSRHRLKLLQSLGVVSALKTLLDVP